MTSLKWPTRANKMWELLAQRNSCMEFKFFCEPCQPWSTSGVCWCFVILFCMLNKTPEADILGLTATDGPQPDNRFVFQWIHSWLISLRTVSTLFVYGFSVGVSSCLKIGICRVKLKENSTYFIQSLESDIHWFLNYFSLTPKKFFILYLKYL